MKTSPAIRRLCLKQCKFMLPGLTAIIEAVAHRIKSKMYGLDEIRYVGSKYQTTQSNRTKKLTLCAQSFNDPVSDCGQV